VEVLPGAAVLAVALIAVSVLTVGQFCSVALSSILPVDVVNVQDTRMFTTVSFPFVTLMPVAPPEHVTDPSGDVPVSAFEYPLAATTGRISKVGITSSGEVKVPAGKGIVPERSSAVTAFVRL
jgi:hypothetical protein